MEVHTLTTPITTSTTTWKVDQIGLWWTKAYIAVDLIGSNGEQLRCEYNGAAATSLMSALNTANLSTSSLHKRILQRLAADGLIGGGSVSGTPA